MQEYQDARSRGVVQLWPGQLDLLQLAENLAPEEFNRLFVASLIRVCLELAVQLTPGEPLRALEREGAAGAPEVEIEAQRRTLEGREGVHVQRHRMADNLVEESPTRFNLAVSESLVCPFPLRRSFVGMMIYNDIK